MFRAGSWSMLQTYILSAVVAGPVAPGEYERREVIEATGLLSSFSAD